MQQAWDSTALASKNVALKKWVTRQLQKDITSGKIPFAGRINESEFAARYNVSRTPLHYAVGQLEADGYLSVYPRRGAFVTLRLLENIEEYYHIRASLEDLLLKQAVRQITDEEAAQLVR
jgi:DNA-binding GntR family transcriptional regulator